jgi:DNA processing protein
LASNSSDYIFGASDVFPPRPPSPSFNGAIAPKKYFFMQYDETMVYGLGITMLDQIGPTRAKQLIACCGSLAAVFEMSRREMEMTQGIRPMMVELVIQQRSRAVESAKRELEQLDKLGGSCLFYSDVNYPQRLKECEDAPMVLYYRGALDFNAPRVISIVGTRRATSYGRYFCDEMMEALAPLGVTIVSGLAYGIDAIAHRAAIRVGLPTIACVAHGLQTLYPPEHRELAHEMQAKGGLVTEFTTTQKMCAELFPMRNRLIAGLADATIVVESDIKGGSMITAYLAHSYNREVYALPGRIDERGSLGCNDLIQRQVAGILTRPDSIIGAMNWDRSKKSATTQLDLFQELTPAQEVIRKGFGGQPIVHMDELILNTGISSQELALGLLDMEFAGLIRTTPGSRYELLHRSRYQGD